MPTLTVYSPTLTAVATIPDGQRLNSTYIDWDGKRYSAPELIATGKHAPGTYASFGDQDTRSWWHITAWTYTPSSADGHHGTPHTPTEGRTTYTLTRLGDEATAFADAILTDRNTNHAHTIDNNISFRGLGDLKPDTIKRMNKAILNQH